MGRGGKFSGRAEGATAGGDAIDRQEVERALAVLADPEHSLELRSLPGGRSVVCSGSDLAGMADAAARMAQGGPKGIYYGLNPNSIPAGSERAARKGDVVRRRWLLIDVDPCRPKESNATDEERSAAYDVIEQVECWLTRQHSWPEPVRIDSGNGYHLLYRIDEPHDEATRVQVREVLKLLARKFDSPGRATIDVAVHDASRIAKLPGTWARKGPHSADRPHRMARLLYVPDGEGVRVVTSGMMARVIAALEEPRSRGSEPAQAAAPSPSASPFAGKAKAATGPAVEAYVQAGMAEELAAVASAPAGNRNNQLNVSSMKLGQLVGAGLVAEADAYSALVSAAESCGLAGQEVERTIRSGMAKGKTEPRQLPASVLSGECVPLYMSKGGTEGGENHFSGGKEAGKPQPPKTVTMAALMRMELPEPQWAIPGILSEGLTILGGKAKLGKSWMALNLGITLAGGGKALGGIRVVAGDVLYLSLEDRLRRVQDRARKVLAGMDMAASERMHLAIEWPRLNAGGLDAIEAWAGQVECPRLVIIDVWAKFRPPVAKGMNAYDNDYAHFDPLKKMSDRLGLSVLIIHHLRKSPGEDKLDALTGSLGIGGSVDGVLILDRQRNTTDAELFVTGRDVEETKLALRFDERKCCWTTLGPAEQYTQSRVWAMAREMLRRPGIQRVTVKSVAEEGKFNDDTVRRTLNRMADRGALKAAPDERDSRRTAYSLVNGEIDVEDGEGGGDGEEAEKAFG